MALEKKSATFNFAQGLDTFNDPNQIPLGRFTALQNSIFIKSSEGIQGALKKANGFGALPSTTSTASYLTTYNNALVGTGNGAIQSYSNAAQAWTNQGFFQPVSLSVNSLIKNAYNQSNQDTALAPNGVGIVVYNAGDIFSTTGFNQSHYKYAIFDSITGQNIIAPINLPLNGGGQIIAPAQAYTIGSNFYVAYATTSTTSNKLTVTQIQNVAPFANVTTKSIDTNISILTGGSPPYSFFDGAAFNGNIYLSWLDTTGNLKASKINPAFTISSATLYTSFNNTGGAMSVTGDLSSNLVYITIGSSFALNMVAIGAVNVSSISFSGAWGVNSANYLQANPFLNGLIQNITSYANNGVYNAIYEIHSEYNLSLPSGPDNILSNKITANTGSSSSVVGNEAVLIYSMGLGSKAFTVNGTPYIIGTFNSTLQSTYFLLDTSGHVISRFAYGNGGGFCGLAASTPNNSLPSVNVSGSQASVSYLFKDLAQSKNTFNVNGSTSGTLIFTQTGINYGTFSFNPYQTQGKDTGNALSLAGGFLWNYDGLQVSENNFFLYPDYLKVTGDASTVASGSLMSGAQGYQYQAIYEWADNQANVHQSTPAVAVTLNALGTLATTSCAATIEVPTLQASYHNQISPNKVTLYRWSQNQQTFYKVGSYAMDGTYTTGSISGFSGLAIGVSTFAAFTFLDHCSDAQILGNEILYTTGGVLEDSAVSSCSSPVVWDSRLWVILSENGELAFSKPVIPSTPIEMSQNFETIFLPPSQGGQGATGLPQCIFPLDDKLIIFCKNVPFYINGVGPDITGANSGYSEPIQIPSAVGCSNPQSIVLTPLGLMFQSDNGIWLLGRDLATRYIGKDVGAYNSNTVTSAVSVPGTSEIRFTLNTGVTLIYDYLVDQWTTRQTNLSPISGAIFNGLHTQSNNIGSIYQETPGTYLDGSIAEVMSFTTGWVNLVNLQGYQRAYWMNILGHFKSGNTYTIGIAYDYNPAIVQTATITPTNTIGSGSQIEQWQVNFKQEQCQSFQLTFNEISSGTAGAGLTISGFDLVYGAKKTYPRNIGAKNRTG